MNLNELETRIKNKVKRKCPLCGEMLEYENFHIIKYGEDKYKLQSPCIECRRSKEKLRARETKFSRIAKKYNMTEAEYHNKLKEQNGKCSICGKEMTKPFLDHCHETGKVRDFLCPTCNTGIGLFNDNTELLTSAILYIKKHKNSCNY